MLIWLKNINDRLRGARTYIVALLVMILGALNASDLVPLFPEHWQKWATAFLPVIFVLLRFVTTGPPMGRNPSPGDSP